MGTVHEMGMKLEATDITQQKVRRVTVAQPDVTVQEIIEPLLAQMDLPKNDSEGRPLTYQARLERTGSPLQSHERVGDVLQTGDRLVLQPNIDAGTEKA